MNNQIKMLETWKNSLYRLNENKFLDIVRLYVGIIKTPYNKEKLVGDLVSFLYKEEHKKNIIDLLSKKDILFLAAIHFLENPTNETVLAFFGGEYTAFYLYDYIANLEERLLIYRSVDEKSKKECLAINPLLEEQLAPFFNLSVLLPLEKASTTAVENEIKPILDSSLFASWYAFIAQNPDACRADGTFKKKTQQIIETVFYGISIDFLVILNTSFLHLGLFFHDGTNLCINEKKWNAFAVLPKETQQHYICVASFRRFQRDTLLKHTHFSKNLVDCIPSEGYTLETLLRLRFFLTPTQNNTQKSGFFANVLQRATAGDKEEDSFSEKSLIERLLFFGILEVKGKNEEGKDILVQRNSQPPIAMGTEENIPFISINAGFSVTFLTLVPLTRMLPLVSCMDVVSFDTVTRFEITRSSCMRYFDKNGNAKTLLEYLEKASGNKLSQNLSFSITEWYETYNSASLYHGYVLQVSSDKTVQIENSTTLAPRIKKILAPGIYIFDFESREDMMEAIEKSSLDFIGAPKTVVKEPDVLSFAELQQRKSLNIDYSTNVEKTIDITDTHLLKMKKELDKLNLPIEQKEGLSERINRKLIVSEKQLVGETVRFEKTEASGIDFMGKIQVIEQAISASNLVEIKSANATYVGRPIKIEKRDGDANVTLVQEDTKTIMLLIGQARNVKRFRQPLY